jgi:hypothetical protein
MTETAIGSVKFHQSIAISPTLGKVSVEQLGAILRSRLDQSFE